MPKKVTSTPVPPVDVAVVADTPVAPVSLNAWASTLPSLRKGPRVGQQCAAPDCVERLQMHEECYYVTELPQTEEGLSELAVCWRHVHPAGPVNA